MLSNLRFVLRSLARRSGYSALCIVTLGLATGVSFAVVAFVDAALLRPVPLAEPERTVTLLQTWDGGTSSGFVYPVLERVRELRDVFEAVAGAGLRAVPVTVTSARMVNVAFVSERYFDVTGVQPVLGRGFAGAEHMALAGQVAVVVVATIGAGLFMKSLRAVAATDVGVDVERLSYARVSFGRRGQSEQYARSFHDRILERLAGRPEVEAVTFGDLPLVASSLSVDSVTIDGEAREIPRLRVFLAGPEYARVVGLRLLAGRDFTSRDVEGGERVAIVSDAVARRLWPNEDPLGQRFGFLASNPAARVVGVVSDGRYGRRLQDEATLAVFLPWEQNRGLAGRSVTIIGRHREDGGALGAAMEREVSALDGELPVLEAGTFRDRLGVFARPQRVGAMSWAGSALSPWRSRSWACTARWRRRRRAAGGRSASGAPSGRARRRWSWPY